MSRNPLYGLQKVGTFVQLTGLPGWPVRQPVLAGCTRRLCDRRLWLVMKSALEVYVVHDDTLYKLTTFTFTFYCSVCLSHSCTVLSRLGFLFDVVHCTSLLAYLKLLDGMKLLDRMWSLLVSRLASDNTVLIADPDLCHWKWRFGGRNRSHPGICARRCCVNLSTADNAHWKFASLGAGAWHCWPFYFSDKVTAGNSTECRCN